MQKLLIRFVALLLLPGLLLDSSLMGAVNSSGPLPGGGASWAAKNDPLLETQALAAAAVNQRREPLLHFLTTFGLAVILSIPVFRPAPVKGTEVRESAKHFGARERAFLGENMVMGLFGDIKAQIAALQALKNQRDPNFWQDPDEDMMKELGRDPDAVQLALINYALAQPRHSTLQKGAASALLNIPNTDVVSARLAELTQETMAELDKNSKGLRLNVMRDRIAFLQDLLEKLNPGALKAWEDAHAKELAQAFQNYEARERESARLRVLGYFSAALLAVFLVFRWVRSHLSRNRISPEQDSGSAKNGGTMTTRASYKRWKPHYILHPIEFVLDLDTPDSERQISKGEILARSVQLALMYAIPVAAWIYFVWNPLHLFSSGNLFVRLFLGTLLSAFYGGLPAYFFMSRVCPLLCSKAQIVEVKPSLPLEQKKSKSCLDINKFVQSIVEQWREQWKSESFDSILLYTHLAASPIIIHGDPVGLSGVLIDLLNNAKDAIGFRPEGPYGAIEVSTRNNPEAVFIDVDDNGSGKQSDELPLWAAAAKSMLELLGGSLIVDSLTNKEYQRLRHLESGIQFYKITPITRGILSNMWPRIEAHLRSIEQLWQEVLTAKESNQALPNDWKEKYDKLIHMNPLETFEKIHEEALRARDYSMGWAAIADPVGKIRSHLKLLVDRVTTGFSGITIGAKITKSDIQLNINQIRNALQLFQRVAEGHRPDVGTTFTIRLPLSLPAQTAGSSPSNRQRLLPAA